MDVAISKIASHQLVVAVSYTPSSYLDDRIIRFSGEDDRGGELDVFTSRIDALSGAEQFNRVSLDMVTRDFESKQIVAGDTLHLSHLDPAVVFDTTLVSDGSFSASLPEGDYAVVLKPSSEKAPVARIFVTREHLADDRHNFVESGRLVNQNGVEVEQNDYSYLVFGADAIPAMMTLRSDYSGFAEVMTDTDFVSRMSSQLRNLGRTNWINPDRDIPDNLLVHFDTARPILMATFSGEGISPSWPHPLVCEGLPVAPEVLGYHEQFYTHSLALLNSVQVGGNPYKILERRVLTPHDSFEAILCINYNVRVPDTYAKEGAAFHLFDDAETSYFYPSRYRAIAKHFKRTGPVFVMVSAKFASKTDVIGRVAHENRVIWALSTRTQGALPNGSVRDGSESGWLPDKPPVPTDVVQYEFDDRFVRVATAFGPWAQYQLNPHSGLRGKNVRLLE